MNYKELIEELKKAKDLITTKAETFAEATYKDILRDECLAYVREYDKQVEISLKGEVYDQYVLC